jgi:hypothetical protein
MQFNGDEVPLSLIPSLRIDIEDVEVIAGRTKDELPILGMTQRRPALITENVNGRVN